MPAEPARLSTLSGPSGGPPPATWDELVRRIGETPLAPVRVRMGRREWTLLLKLESHNPFGSIKDRTAYSLIRALEIENAAEGRLTVVESTSGNLGLALAAMCRLRGHSFVAVVDPKVSDYSLGVMRRLGARVEMVTRADATGNHLAGRIARVREICDSQPNVHRSNQYARSANPRVHYLQTGPEILRQTGSDLDCVLVAVSTGGTLGGIGAYLRSASPLIQVIGSTPGGRWRSAGAPGRAGSLGSGRAAAPASSAPTTWTAAAGSRTPRRWPSAASSATRLGSGWVGPAGRSSRPASGTWPSTR